MLSGKLFNRKNFHDHSRDDRLMTAIKKIAVLTAALLLPLFCFAVNSSAASLKVEDAWIKLAPPAATSHAGYLRLINNNKQALTISHISATGYAHAMLHQTKIVKDKAQMDHLQVLEVPAGAVIALTPGAIHLMLMNPQQPQKVNDQVTITLEFSDGTQQKFVALVQANHE